MDTREARTLIAQVELISHGSVQAWDSSGGHSAEKPLLPAGEPNPPHIALRAQLAQAQTQSQVDKVTQKAREALTAARYTPRNTALLIHGTKEWREAIGLDKRIAEEVAEDYGITVRHVHRLRALCRDKAA
jgi:hypothetical protein